MATAFSAGDLALLDVRGSAAPALSLNGTVLPGAVTVSGAKNHTTARSGSLAGTMALTKSGSGTLTLSIAAANNYSGGRAIDEGTLALSGASTLGSGAVTLGGAALSLSTAAAYVVPNAIVIAAPSTIATAANTTFSGAFSGSGSLGISTALFTPEGTWAGFTGSVTLLNRGTLALGNAVANIVGLGLGPITFKGGTLAMWSTPNFPPAGLSDVTIWDLAVSAGQTGTLYADPRCTLDGSLSGAGTLNFSVPFTRTDLIAD